MRKPRWQKEFIGYFFVNLLVIYALSFAACGVRVGSTVTSASWTSETPAVEQFEASSVQERAPGVYYPEGEADSVSSTGNEAMLLGIVVLGGLLAFAAIGFAFFGGGSTPAQRPSPTPKPRPVQPPPVVHKHPDDAYLDGLDPQFGDLGETDPEASARLIQTLVLYGLSFVMALFVLMGRSLARSLMF